MAPQELFRSTAAIFIGSVKSADATCPGGGKPCTKVTFSEIELIAGNLPKGDITFDLPEGELEDGSFLRIEGAPRFVPGVRYLVFVRGGDWYNTPVTNWFHSVFRELRAGPQAEATVFVDHQGRAVRGFDERGFKLGEQIAQSNDVIASRVSLSDAADATRAQMGVAQSSSPAMGTAAKEQGARPDGKALAAPKQEFVGELRAAASKYGLSDKAVRLAPSQPALRRAQGGAVRGQAGLEAAATEPARARPEQPSASSDSVPAREPAAGRRSHPGQDTTR